MINLIQPITVQQAYLSGDEHHEIGEHHQIGDGGWLMMTMATDSPLQSPELTPDQPSREVLGLGGGSVS